MRDKRDRADHLHVWSRSSLKMSVLSSFTKRAIQRKVKIGGIFSDIRFVFYPLLSNLRRVKLSHMLQEGSSLLS